VEGKKRIVGWEVGGRVREVSPHYHPLGQNIQKA